jgi:hypothetical protein
MKHTTKKSRNGKNCFLRAKSRITKDKIKLKNESAKNEFL